MSKLRLYTIFGGMLIALLSVPALAAQNPREGIDYYLRTYGQVDPNALPDVYEVFNRVLNAADKNNLYRPQLIVINDDRQISAFVLSDGNIFVSRRALETIRAGVDQQTFQIRLAFVLGHELAHLANNDFWDEQVSQALLEFSSDDEVTSILNTSMGRLKNELKADDQGFLFAALAGYKVEYLLDTTATQDNFFTFWSEKVDAKDDVTHPKPEQRAAVLRSRLSEQRQVIDIYHFGVRLIHFGRYQEAIELLKVFQKYYPGRELFNNLGYAHLKQALSELPTSYINYYWLPTVSDTQTRFSSLGYRSASNPNNGMGNGIAYSAQVRESMIKAIEYLKLAVEKDNQYLPAYINLATAQFLLEKTSTFNVVLGLNSAHFSQTIATIETALHRFPTESQLLFLKAIVLNELGQRQSVDAALRDIPAAEKQSLAATYNIARLSQNTDSSYSHWKDLLNKLMDLPFPIQQQLCQEKQEEILELYSRQAFQTICINRSFPRFTQTNFPWNLPMALSRDLLEYPLIDNELKEFDWKIRELEVATVLESDSASVLAIDDITTLLVFKEDVLGDVKILYDCCGSPRSRETLSTGEVWSYGPWAAVVENNQIREVWVNSY